MSDVVSVMIFERDGAKRLVSLELTQGDTCSITLLDGDIPTKSYEAVDLFEALCSLRLDLADRGAIVACNGSRKNVYPSGMGRSMSSGRMAYVLRMGRKTGMDDLVDIFDSADPREASSVEEQRKFYSEWIRNISK